MRTLKDIEKEIVKCKKQYKEHLASLELEREEHIKKSDLHKIAELLHDIMCKSNHIDQCDWDYGDWLNPKFAQKQYLERAQELIKLWNEPEDKVYARLLLINKLRNI